MTQTSYDTDFYRWTQAQAEALRAKDWPALDVANLAEEIESLGKSDRRAVQSHLVVLVEHLLKWACRPQERAWRGAGWQDSIDEARRQIELILHVGAGVERCSLRRVTQRRTLLPGPGPGSRLAAGEPKGDGPLARPRHQVELLVYKVCLFTDPDRQEVSGQACMVTAVPHMACRGRS